jgi:hypothetical protein
MLLKPRFRRRQSGTPPARIRPGDYLTCEGCLYHVEHVAGERVLIEDCRSGELLDIDRDTCAALERIKRSTDSGSLTST